MFEHCKQGSLRDKLFEHCKQGSLRDKLCLNIENKDHYVIK